MSSKAVTQPFQVVVDGNMATEVISKVTTVNTQDNAAYQVVYTGAPDGTFLVEATINGSSWTPLVFATPITVSNSPSPFLINMNQLPYHQIRLRYVPTGGTGTLQVHTMAKRLGG